MRAHCARVRHFSFFAFTSSPTSSITLSFSQLGVKTFAFEPSPESGECFAKIAPLREHKTAKAFTPNAMIICNLQPAGEEVKAKNEKQLTRTRA